MSRQAALYEDAKGSPLVGYFMLKAAGRNIPRNWFERAASSRQNRHESVAEALRDGNWSGYNTLRDWEEAYLKECFY